MDAQHTAVGTIVSRDQPRRAGWMRRLFVEPMQAVARAVPPARVCHGLNVLLLGLLGRPQSPGVWQRIAGKLRQVPWCYAGYRCFPSGLRSRLRRFFLDKSVPILAVRKTVAPESASSPTAVDYGINIVGYVRAELGIGESSRLAAQACQSVGLPFSMHDFNVGNSSRAADRRWEHKIAPENKHWVNVFHINADQMPLVYQHLGSKFFQEHYNIGFWHWELGDFPDEWASSFDLVDEVWAPTHFVVDAISRKSPVPVLRIPHGIRIVPDASVRRRDLGLPESKFLFLSMYDAHSYQSRKNPQAAIRAFLQAFPDAKDVALVVKINNPRSFPEQIESLKALVQDRPGIILLDRIFSRQEVYDLESLCDCFVSLHRSEGFGLGLAESMAMGKPVIGTNWSGNVDFMNPDNSCCVDWSPLQVGSDYPLSTSDTFWADADVGHAAWFMTKLVNDRPWARELGLRAQASIARDFSPEAVGRLCRARLDVIAKRHGKVWQGMDCRDDRSCSANRAA